MSSKSFAKIFLVAAVLATLVTGALFAKPAHSLETMSAGFKGSVSFTEQEMSEHRGALPVIMRETSACLSQHLKRQQTFYRRWGISPYYGSASRFSRMTTQEREQELASLGLPVSLLSKMRPTSCIGLTVECMGYAFKKAGQSATWQKLKTYADANDMDGSALQDGLRHLGWKVLYWNPDISRNKIWDNGEKERDPTNAHHSWGYHEYRWHTVNSPTHNYYFNTVDDYHSLVNFGTRPPADFENVPFFVGTAHGGYHVFPGMFGQVIEGHSTREITDPQTVESSQFNPSKDGGGPRGNYHSGIIAVPPGYGF